MLCFIHIERAGGTTLHNMLINNFFLDHLILTPWDYWTNDEGSIFTKNDFRRIIKYAPNLKSIGGHTVRTYKGYEEVRPDIKYFTFLRDPVSRYISHFQYQINVMKKKWTIGSFLSEERFDNFMTKRIAGCNDVNKAKKHLTRDYTFVGLTEKFDESLLIMKNKLKLPNFDVCYEKRNISRDNSLKKNILADKKILNEIKERNLLDLELYDYVKNELFAKENRGESFYDDLKQYKNTNVNYKFPFLKKFAYDIFRYSYYRNIDLIIHKLLKDA